MDRRQIIQALDNERERIWNCANTGQSMYAPVRDELQDIYHTLGEILSQLERMPIEQPTHH